MLKEKAGQNYFVQDKSCAEAILLAANEAYHLGMTEEATKLFAGFRTGMGMGGTCGALSGAIGVLSSKYGTREDLKTICADFVAAFEQKLALGTTECAPLAAKYKTEGKRCRDAVELTAEALEEFIDKLEGKAPAEGCTLRPEDIKRVKGMGFCSIRARICSTLASSPETDALPQRKQVSLRKRQGFMVMDT